jgi:hypothetical protein
MINRIMNLRVAAVALAASALIAAPAVADPVRGTVLELNKRVSSNTGLTIQVAHNSGHSHRNTRRANHYRVNEWGQSQREVRQLKRDATQACRRAISRQAYNIGFRDVDFDDDRRVNQIGPNGFRVSFDEVEFEGRRREFERRVTCTVRRGQVRHLDGIPQPGRRAARRNGLRY